MAGDVLRGSPSVLRCVGGGCRRTDESAQPLQRAAGPASPTWSASTVRKPAEVVGVPVAGHVGLAEADQPAAARAGAKNASGRCRRHLGRAGPPRPRRGRRAIDGQRQPGHGRAEQRRAIAARAASHRGGMPGQRLRRRRGRCAAGRSASGPDWAEVTGSGAQATVPGGRVGGRGSLGRAFRARDARAAGRTGRPRRHSRMPGCGCAADTARVDQGWRAAARSRPRRSAGWRRPVHAGHERACRRRRSRTTDRRSRGPGSGRPSGSRRRPGGTARRRAPCRSGPGRGRRGGQR